MKHPSLHTPPFSDPTFPPNNFLTVPKLYRMYSALSFCLTQKHFTEIC